ncbi:phage tail family protein [Clostridium sporogenes]|nr:phage tail family protein [Clostridium sporogenes]MCW6085584.1 phage tail family protein [Clostridium sporogenes]STC76899.1 phage-like protein [Clostridium botulinum]
MYAKFINSLGVEIEFTDTAPLILQKIDITNNVNIYNSKGMSQDGSTYNGNTLDIKDIPVQVALNASNPVELDMLKDKMNTIFNPKLNEGYLFYKNKKIKCIANKLPYYNENVNNIYCECLIHLTAHNPYWEDIRESKKQIALWKGDFHFPLVIPQGKGITMGHRERSLIVNVNNTGQVKTGMIIEFFARGTLSNPSLFNVNTREFIKINKGMVAGEKFIINTNYSKKKILQELNGVTTDILNYLDIVGGGDTFLQLDVGDNLFRYNTDSNLDNLEVNIYFSPQYLGV